MTTHSKLMLDRSDNKSKLICETDAFAFVSDCSAYQREIQNKTKVWGGGRGGGGMENNKPYQFPIFRPGWALSFHESKNSKTVYVVSNGSLL